MPQESITRRSLRWLSSTALYRAAVLPAVNQIFYMELLRRTRDYAGQTWLGQPIRQAPLDFWTLQETLCRLRPALLIETGTSFGGSALFYAQLFDLLGGGRVISVDIQRLHTLTHSRIEFLIGSSTAPEVLAPIRQAAQAAGGPVLVILDGDHSQAHVRQELELYSPLVTPGSYVLVQDGCIDTSAYFQHLRPGPLPAIHDFLRAHPEFEIDRALCDRYVVTHHPDGWLKRRR
jgi:cephalosporin hydroxylase